MFKKNSFVKWTTEDETGSFSYVGQVVSHTKGVITMMTADGEMAVPETDGTFRLTKKRAKLPVKKHLETKAAPKKAVAKRATTKAKGPSPKVQLIIDLLKGRELSRKEAIAEIVAAGISTPAGASTQFNTAKKFL